jgi:hypothetical protein
VVAPIGIIKWQDGEEFQGQMLHDRPREGNLTYADGSSAQVEYSKNCDDPFSGYKPTPKKPSPQKDLRKRQISESPESTSLSAGESGSNSKQHRKRTVTLTKITGDRADVEQQRQRVQEHQRKEQRVQRNPSEDPHVGNAVSNGVHADLKPCGVSGCGVTGDGGTADDAVYNVPWWLKEVMNTNKITVLRDVLRREQVQESDLDFFKEAALKEAGLVKAILTSYAKILREIRDSPEARGGGRKDDGPQTPGKGKAKPFEQWSVDEVCRLLKSIDGVGYAEAADVVKEIGINSKYFADMLRNNDEDLTKCIADDGLGFKKLQLKLLKAKIEES